MLSFYGGHGRAFVDHSIDPKGRFWLFTPSLGNLGIDL